MKTTMRLLTALVVICFLGTISLAESDGPGWGKGKGQRRHKRERKEKFGPGYKIDSERFCDNIDATPEQRKQLKQIGETHRQAMKNWQKENGKKLRKARNALKEAKKSGDEEAIDAAKLKLRKLNESRRELGKNFREQLSEVLTKEQMQKMRKIRKHRGPGERPKHPGMMGKRPYGKLNLTDKQKAEIKKLRTESAEKAKSAKTREEKHEIFKNLRKKINKDVLTKEQRKKAAKHFRGRQKGRRDMFLKGLDATDKQEARIDKIMKKAREKAEGKDPDERRKIMNAAREKIRKNVLTEKQRKKMRKQMRKMRMRGRKMFFDKVGLTKDQRAQAREILATAEKKTEGKSSEERRDIIRAAHKKIHKKVLTDEQREKVEKMKDNCGKGKKKFGDRRPGEGRGPKHRKPKAHRKHRDRERDDDDDDDDDD